MYIRVYVCKIYIIIVQNMYIGIKSVSVTDKVFLIHGICIIDKIYICRCVRFELLCLSFSRQGKMLKSIYFKNERLTVELI